MAVAVKGSYQDTFYNDPKGLKVDNVSTYL